MAVLQVMKAEHGDLPIEWDPTNEVEVNAARETFARYKSLGYFAYAVRTVDGEPSNEQLREFDPDAQRIVMTQQLQGG